MNLFVSSSHRALLNFCKSQNAPFLPPVKSISDFFGEVVICDGAKLPKNLRALFLWKVIQDFRQDIDSAVDSALDSPNTDSHSVDSRDFDLSKIGFDKSFLRFLEGSNFIFKFFDELDSACVKISDIDINDTYGDYSDHLRILEGIYGTYNALLKSRGLYDKAREYRVNEAFLRAYEHIFIYIDGILSVKEMRILRECAGFTNITLFFTATKYNSNLLQKMLGQTLEWGHKYSFSVNSGEITRLEPLYSATQSINLYSFDLRISQALLVVAKVNEWLKISKKSAENDKMAQDSSDFAVILPDENFATHLRLFDEMRNLNYAMGFKDNALQKKLRDLRQKCQKENLSTKELLNHILEHFRLENELEIRSMRDILESLSVDEIIEFLLQNVANLNDNSGGKVGVFGVLESRAMSFDGAIIVDFNDDFIPHLNDNDMFLNTRIRNSLNLPTLRDKEDLQRHYYFMLISSTKCVEIAYCRNSLISSLANDLRALQGVRFAEMDGDKKWRFFPKERVKEYISDEIIAKNSLTQLSATAIKTFLECRRKFYFSYLCGGLRNSEDKEEFLGTKIHNILREMGSDFDEGKIAHLVAQNVSDSKLDLEITLMQLGAFFRAQKLALQNGTEIVAVEQSKKFQINDFDFVCKVDRIDRVKMADGTDKIRIIDYKLKKDFSVKKEGFLQLCIYKRAFEQELSAFGGSEIECLYIDLLNNKEFIMDSNAEAEANEILNNALEMLKGEINFTQCEDRNPCKYCEYVYLCDRY